MSNIKLALVDRGVFRGGRPDASRFVALRAAGIKGVLDLESGFYERLTKTDKEADLALVAGIDHNHFPLSDFLPPSAVDVAQCLSYVKKKRDEGGVYIHCLHGVDRTGIVCAAYRVWEQKWTTEQALTEMLNNGFHRRYYWWWLPQIRRILEVGEAP